MGCVISAGDQGGVLCSSIVSVEVAETPRVVPAAQTCPSFGSSWKELGNAFGGSHSDPQHSAGPVTSSPWWRWLGFVHSLCFFPALSGRRGIADPSGAEEVIAGCQGIWDLGMEGAWCCCRRGSNHGTKTPSLQAVGAVPLSSTLSYFSFQIKDGRL